MFQKTNKSFQKTLQCAGSKVDHVIEEFIYMLPSDMKLRIEKFKNYTNKKLYQAFSRQPNELTLNIPVLQGLLIRTLKKMRKVDKLKIMNYNLKV